MLKEPSTSAPAETVTSSTGVALARSVVDGVPRFRVRRNQARLAVTGLKPKEQARPTSHLTTLDLRNSPAFNWNNGPFHTNLPSRVTFVQLRSQ